LRSIFIKHNCRKPLPFPSDSVDHILSSHFLEHVFPSEAEKIIKDFHRVLKKGGTIHIIVPDIEFIVKEYLEAKDNGIQDAADKFIKRTILSRETRGSFKYRIVEFLGNLGLQHHWMYDKSSIILRLKKLDFKILEYYSSPSSNYRVGDNSVHLLVRKE
jgi:predicted SAM-dependent methyltransferase